jgi:hypothetical protein
MQAEIRENTFDAGVVTINYAEISSSRTPLVLFHGGVTGGKVSIIYSPT